MFSRENGPTGRKYEGREQHLPHLSRVLNNHHYDSSLGRITISESTHLSRVLRNHVVAAPEQAVCCNGKRSVCCNLVHIEGRGRLVRAVHERGLFSGCEDLTHPVCMPLHLVEVLLYIPFCGGGCVCVFFYIFFKGVEISAVPQRGHF